MAHRNLPRKALPHILNVAACCAMKRSAHNSPFARSATSLARAHIMDAKHPIICGLPQPRSFVPRKGGMMFSLHSKWCWPSVKWCCACGTNEKSLFRRTRIFELVVQKCNSMYDNLPFSLFLFAEITLVDPPKFSFYSIIPLSIYPIKPLFTFLSVLLPLSR